MERGDKSEAAPLQEKTVEENVVQDVPVVSANDAKKTSEFGSKKENHVYKCKYIVPYASEIVYDERDPFNKRTMVQVYNQNVDMRFKVQDDNLEDKNIFSMLLYNITDVTATNRPEMTPAESKTYVPINKPAF